jgi:hypothetical protein
MTETSAEYRASDETELAPWPPATSQNGASS